MIHLTDSAHGKVIWVACKNRLARAGGATGTIVGK
jgi:hypothetical protein